jgi:AcrR family transcriptional regulator
MTTKEKIKHITFELLSDNGYISTSMRKIAKEVGIRESAIYNHFASKDELMKSIFDEIETELDLVKLIDDELLDKLHKPKIFLIHFSEKLLDHWANERQQKIFRILLLEQFSTHGLNIKVNSVLDKTKEVWKIVFSEMMNHKFIKKQDVDIVTNEFIAPIFYIRLKYLTSKNVSYLDTAIKEVTEHVEYFWDSIKK